ncbi:MAG: mandelate racemase/muconate lactonizing enzyme family protein [Chloroflexota bacterium]
MKITHIETMLFEPTWDDPFAQRPRRTYAAIKVHTDDGLIGISRTGAAGVRVIRDYLEPALLGEDPRNVERLWTRMFDATIKARAGTIGVIGAVDIALWDLLGKASGLPCWQLLGGYRDWVPVYCDVPTRAQTPQELGEQLAACVELGFDAVKFHILSTDPDHIVAETEAGRAALGPDVKLAVDLFGWIDVRTAIDIAQRIERYDIFFLEEPVLRHDQSLGLAVVARHTRIPLAGAEGASSLFEVRSILEGGGLTYLQTDVVGAGGYTPWRKIAALAEAHHVLLAPHGATLPDVNAPLVAAYRHGAIIPATTPNQPPEIWAHLYQDFRIERGRVQLTSRPGLGLEFDEDFLRRHAVATSS